MSGHPTPYVRKTCVDPNNGKDVTRDAQLPSWCSEVYQKIHYYGDNMDDFLDAVVPSPTPCTLPDPDVSISKKFIPVKGQEKKSYEPLMKIFEDLVTNFPDDKKLSFYNAHDQPLSFPFPEFAKRHHVAKPDIMVSFPGETLPSRIKRPDWSQFSMVIEAKDTMEQDPFYDLDDPSFDKAKTLVQLAISARSLMIAHGFLATFAFGVYGDVVRIGRFDHACAVASPPLNLKTAAGLKGIRNFFWRFSHPWSSSPRAVVGCDSTIRKLTDSDIGWLRRRLGAEASDLLHGIDLQKHARRVEVWDEEGSTSRAFIAFKPIEFTARLFSRSTMVWLGIEDTRGADGMDGEEDGEDGDVQLCVIKEAWRQLPRTPEKVFYEQLKQTVPEDEWVGIPHMVCGGDLGLLEAKHYEAASKSSGGQTEWPAGFESDTSIAYRNGVRGDPPRPFHQTYTWRLTRGPHWKPQERSHVRFIVDVVGRPLSKFRRSKELALAMRDALKGHSLAMRYGGILHRDISSGNILIVERAASGSSSKGVVHDFDYSSMLLKPPKIVRFPRKAKATEPDSGELHPLELSDEYENIMELKERTGTYYFIAIELIDPDAPVVPHDTHHDLESFFWVLLWIVLRHTHHNHVDGREACSKVFKFGSDTDALAGKTNWLFRRYALQISGNKPLSDLLEGFKNLVDKANARTEPVPLTYEAVLAVFDEALARPDWPENDAAIPFSPREIPANTVHEGAFKRPSRLVQPSKRTASYATEVVSGAPTGSTTLASNNSERSKRQKTSHRSTPAASSFRVPSHTSRRSGKTPASNATSGRTKASGGRRGAKASASSSRNASGTPHS
ncbi:hypothetical protein BD413DRAFT_477403 [Trametes elegans]|nr:hypothetical protein BD413DRAFT_477403 [Trametes elegans]